MATYSTSLRPLGLVLWLSGCGWLLATSPCRGQDLGTITAGEQTIDLVMFHDPPLEVGKVSLSFPAGTKELWHKAMQRPDSELQRLAADSFALAHQRGMQNLEETHSQLADLLTAPDQDPAVIRAAAHALVELDARDYADLLAETAKSQGLATALLIEPALARWKSAALQDVWLARLDDPSASRAARVLAINGLGEMGGAEAADSLKRIASHTKLKVNVRLAAARALSKIRAPGLVDLAQGLIASEPHPAVLSSMLAIELMQTDASPEVIAILRKLVSHDITAVQKRALQRLYAIDPKHVYDFAEAAVKSNDAGVRTVGAQALIVQEDRKWIAPLAALLNDANPTLRRHVAQELVRLAKEPELHGEVIKQATMVLNHNQWRGNEQAAIVLVLLDHKAAGDRLVELLAAPRGEVGIASAWGLRRLALPEHLPAMFDQAKTSHEVFVAGEVEVDLLSAEMQITQLFMAFGQMRYEEAESLLLTYVPKDHSLGVFARAAAVWSLGFLNEGEAPADLTASLVERIADVYSLEPEADLVRRMSVISIGRMKSESALKEMRTFVTTNSGYIKRACYWTVEQLTGETPPPPNPHQVNFTDWFLVPAP